MNGNVVHLQAHLALSIHVIVPIHQPKREKLVNLVLETATIAEPRTAAPAPPPSRVLRGFARMAVAQGRNASPPHAPPAIMMATALLAPQVTS